MKKPALAAMGLIGACAACCAIPLAIPLISGLSVAGLASIDWGGLTMGSELAIVAGLAAAGLVTSGLWWHRRRTAAAQCALPTPAASGCGCATKASNENP